MIIITCDIKIILKWIRIVKTEGHQLNCSGIKQNFFNLVLSGRVTRIKVFVNLVR